MNERGSALLIAVLSTSLLTTLGLGMILTSVTETMIGANFRDAQRMLYAADAGVELSLHELMRASDWNPVLGGLVGAGAGPGWPGPVTPTPDLTNRTARLQRETDRLFGTDANRPVWRLYGHAPVAALLPAGAVPGRIHSFARVHVSAWVADDPWETDGDSSVDENGMLLVRVEAVEGNGRRGSRRAVEVTVTRTGLAAAESDRGPGAGAAQMPAIRATVWRQVY